MLFVHEVHDVVGEHERAFEDAYREGWMPVLADGEDARLLWFLHHAHGSGPAYNVVTITAVRDGDAYERLIGRMRAGDLHEWTRSVDAMRHRVQGKVLLPVEWSPLQEVDFDEVPTDGAEHELSLYMEDTGWPTAPLDDYIAFWDEQYYRIMRRTPPDQALLRIDACFQPALATHRRPEATLVQRIMDHRLLANLITEPEEYDPDTWPGSYMHGGLRLRDQWESKLLRTSSWSPVY